MSEFFDRFYAWATAPRPPVSGPLTREQAIAGLDRVEAWLQLARLAIDTDAANQTKIMIAQVNAVLSNIDPLDDKADHVETRNALIAFALDTAKAFGPALSADVTRLVIERATELSPALATRLAQGREQVRAAIVDAQAGHERKATSLLNRVLTAKSRTAEAKEIWDTYKKTRRRRDNRRGRTGE